MRCNNFLISIAVFSFSYLFSFPALGKGRGTLNEQVREQIRVEAELLVNGKVISAPRIVALAGEPASISVGQVGGKELMRMDVTAKPTSSKMDEIILDMDFKYVVGDRVIKSSPQVYVKSGLDAVMTLEESSASEKIQLRVMAKPVVR